MGRRKQRTTEETDLDQFEEPTADADAPEPGAPGPGAPGQTPGGAGGTGGGGQV
jgi:hypothetical protein